MSTSSHGAVFDLASLDSLGELLRQSAYHGEDITCLLPHEVREVLVTVLELSGAAPTLSEGFAIVTAHWHSTGDLSVASQARLSEVLAHAAARAERLGVVRWDGGFDEIVCEKFLRSVTSAHGTPSPSTMHLRRSSLRAAFTTLRRLGLFSGDPTIDLVLPPRSQLAARAAGDDEIVLLRMNAVASRESRQPATMALAETTATTSEIPRVTGCDLDDPLLPTSVRLPGSKGVRPRSGVFSPWGAKVMATLMRDRRAAGIADTEPLVYFGDKADEASGQASTCSALHSVMRRAGLHKEADFSPRSIGFWAGRQAFDAADTAKVEAAAKAMGIKSLDKAARRVDYSWDVE